MIIVFVYSNKNSECNRVKHLWNRISEKYKEKINTGEINIDYHPGLLPKLGISNVPSVIFVHPNTFSEYKDGFNSEYKLERFFKGCIFYLLKNPETFNKEQKRNEQRINRGVVAWGLLTPFLGISGQLLNNYNTVRIKR